MLLGIRSSRKGRCFSPLLPHGPEQNPTDHAGENPPGALAAAAAYFGGSLRPDAAHGGGAKEQWHCFIKRADSQGLILMRLWMLLGAIFILSACDFAENRSSAMREKVAKAMDAGSLTPDAKGMVQLPQELEAASSQGRAFVTIAPSGQRWLLIRYWIGKGANFQGYVYAPGASWKAGDEISLITQCIDEVGLIHNIDVGGKSDGDWYAVSFSLH